jgi:hypothetical protein
LDSFNGKTNPSVFAMNFGGSEGQMRGEPSRFEELNFLFFESIWEQSADFYWQREISQLKLN